MIRKFALFNSKGDEWELTCRNIRSFLHNPDGLGFATSAEVIRYGESAKVTSEEYALPTISGEVIFYDAENGDRYTKYNQFCRFVSHKPLKLVYEVPDMASYYLTGYISSISKTETKEDGLMTCGIEFQGLSFWQGSNIHITGSSQTYTLENEGDFPVGFEITITGSPVNPYIQLEQDSELYGEAKFIDSNAFDEIYVNSMDGEQNVILDQGGSVLPNPLSYQDLSISNGILYVTFVKLARGVSTLTIGMDSGSISSVDIKYKPMYRSV